MIGPAARPGATPDTSIFWDDRPPAGVLNTMDAQQLGQWLDRLGPALVLYARQWCAAPEDVVQEAFVRLAGTTAPGNVRGWLYRVVRNAAISAGRAERRCRHHEG